MLGENYSVATPTPEYSGMSFTEQSGTPPSYQNPVQLDPFAENHLSRELPQEHSAPAKDSDSETKSDSDSQNESGSESMVSWEESPALPSEDTSPVSQKDQATPKAASSWESDSNTPVKDNQISKDTAKIKKQKTNTATKKRLRTL